MSWRERGDEFLLLSRTIFLAQYRRSSMFHRRPCRTTPCYSGSTSDDVRHPSKSAARVDPGLCCLHRKQQHRSLLSLISWMRTQSICRQARTVQNLDDRNRPKTDIVRKADASRRSTIYCGSVPDQRLLHKSRSGLRVRCREAKYPSRYQVQVVPVRRRFGPPHKCCNAAAFE